MIEDVYSVFDDMSDETLRALTIAKDELRGQKRGEATLLQAVLQGNLDDIKNFL